MFVQSLHRVIVSFNAAWSIPMQNTRTEVLVPYSLVGGRWARSGTSLSETSLIADNCRLADDGVSHPRSVRYKPRALVRRSWSAC